MWEQPRWQFGRREKTGWVDAERVLKGMVAARIKIEFGYFKLVNNIMDFSAIWSVGTFLCEVGEDEMLVLKM